nr:MAG TPA: hypothetical protein [Caudoviricetes sp.]
MQLLYGLLPILLKNQSPLGSLLLILLKNFYIMTKHLWLRLKQQ